MITFYYHPSPNPAKVALLLEETGLDPQYLELELTESQLLDSVEHIIGRCSPP